MSESIRQQKNPQGLGTGSVPVLFSLKNVQPSILGSMSKSKSNETPPNRQESTTSVASVPAAIPPTSPTLAKSATKSNRPYNIVVGLLILAVCLLVLRNSQGTKSNSKESIASNNAQPLQSELKPVADSKAELISPPIPKSTVLKPLDLGPSLPGPTNSANANSLAAIPELTNQLRESDRSPDATVGQDSIALIETSAETAVTGTTSEDQPLVQAKPPMLLLPSSKPVIFDETDSAAENNASKNYSAQSGIGFPEPRLAAKPDLRQTDSALAYPRQSAAEASPSSDFNNPGASRNNGAAIASPPAIVDTTSPTTTTRELIDVWKRGNQTTPPNTFSSPSFSRGASPQGVPASPISSVAPGSENNSTSASNAFRPNVANDSQMMSGRPYPPMQKEYQALSIPAYEQNALSGRQGYSNITQSNQLIRQPESGPNRYQSIGPQTSTTTIPYTPIAPTQSGNSIGYPPGN